MADVAKDRNGRPGVWMTYAEIVFAYNILKGEPIPAGTDYHKAASALQKEFGCEVVASTANTMDVDKYVRGEYSFQVENKEKGIAQ